MAYQVDTEYPSCEEFDEAVRHFFEALPILAPTEEHLFESVRGDIELYQNCYKHLFGKDGVITKMKSNTTEIQDFISTFLSLHRDLKKSFKNFMKLDDNSRISRAQLMQIWLESSLLLLHGNPRSEIPLFRDGAVQYFDLSNQAQQGLAAPFRDWFARNKFRWLRNHSTGGGGSGRINNSVGAIPLRKDSKWDTNLGRPKSKVRTMWDFNVANAALNLDSYLQMFKLD